MLRPDPSLHIDFLARNPARRLQLCRRARTPPAQNSHSPCAGTSAPITAARRCATWQRKSTGLSRSPFSISPFAGHIPQSDWMRHLSALRYPRTFPLSQLQQRLFPDSFHSAGPDTEGLLLRDHTNPYFSVGIDRERIHSTAAEIHGVDLRQVVQRFSRSSLCQPRYSLIAFGASPYPARPLPPA